MPGRAGGCERLLGGAPAPRTPPPTYGFGEEPGEEQRREGQERTQQEGREAPRLSLRQRFLSFFPLFLCKKCTKAQQPLCNGQQCFLGEGAGKPQAWHPSLQLKVTSYCLETWVSV